LVTPTVILAPPVRELATSPNCATAGGTISRCRAATSIRVSLAVIHPPPQPGFPTPDAGHKKFNSHPVVPTFIRTSPSSFPAVGFFLWIKLFPAVKQRFKSRRSPPEVLFRPRRNRFPLLNFSQFKQLLPDDFPNPVRYDEPDLANRLTMNRSHEKVDQTGPGLHRA
jgi:hypothetical protein